MFDLVCDPNFTDEEVSNVFFLTYRSFAKPEEFFSYLVKKFYSRPRDNEEEQALFREQIGAIRLKILSVFHKWIEHHWHDFGSQSELRTNLEVFLDLLVDENGEYVEVARGLLFVVNIQVRQLLTIRGTGTTNF